MSQTDPDPSPVAIPSPVLARVWFEGKRVAEENVISAECDGQEVVLDTNEGDEITFAEGEWDDLTVQYDG